MTNAYMPRAQTTEWSTPAKLFDAIDAEFGPITCDPCCLGTEHSALTVLSRGGRIYVPPRSLFDDEPGALQLLPDQVRENGLTLDWPADSIVYMNPPYGDEMPQWIFKAVTEATHRVKRVIALLPVRSDTKAWQDYIMREISETVVDGHEWFALERHPLCRRVRFLSSGSPGMTGTRVKFGNQKESAPFPSVLVVWERSPALPSRFGNR